MIIMPAVVVAAPMVIVVIAAPAEIVKLMFDPHIMVGQKSEVIVAEAFDKEMAMIEAIAVENVAAAKDDLKAVAMEIKGTVINIPEMVVGHKHEGIHAEAEIDIDGCPSVVIQTEAGPENASGIVTFFHPDKNLGETHQTLTAAGITTSLRTDRAGQNFIRLSPHYYNTDAELERVLSLV